VSLYATETTVKQIEDAFKEFTAREDIAIVLISQYVSINFVQNHGFDFPQKHRFVSVISAPVRHALDDRRFKCLHSCNN
jgi:hypothetical protein